MKDWNKPAFPTDDNGEEIFASEGMTLLDYFAGQALQSIASGYIKLNKTDEQIVKESYGIAVEMIKERERVISKLEKITR